MTKKLVFGTALLMLASAELAEAKGALLVNNNHPDRMAHVFDKLELREACETLKSDPSVRIDRVKQTTRVGLYELAVEGENGVVCTLRLLSGILEFQRIWPQFVKQVEEEVKDESKTFVCNNPRLASPAALAVNVMEIHSATSSSVYTVYRPAACELE